MSFQTNTNGVPVLRNYAEAVLWEKLVTPIRGRSPECKPLGDRKKTHASIRRENEDIIVRIYQTDIVRYKPDGTVIIRQGGHESMATRAYLNAVLPLWFTTFQGQTVWSHHGLHHLLHAREDNIFRLEGNNVSPEFTNPKPCIIHCKDRAGIKAVRAKYAAFRKYVRNIEKLMGGKIDIIERVGREYLTPDALLALASSDEPEQRYKALAYLAWVNQWRSGRADVLAQLDKIMFLNHRDEVFVKATLPPGVVKRDEYKRLF